jgi:hypothetical protein
MGDPLYDLALLIMVEVLLSSERIGNREYMRKLPQTWDNYAKRAHAIEALERHHGLFVEEGRPPV